METIISGFGCVCALGDNTDEITNNLYNGSARPSFIKDRFDGPYVNEYPVFQVSENMLAQKRDDESYSFLFLRKALDEAMEKAGLTKEDLKNAKVGVCIGTSVDASFDDFDFYKEWKLNSHLSLEPLNKYLQYSVSNEVLKYLGIDGVSQTIVTMCSAGTDAIGIAGDWIESSLCDIVIAGGTDELNIIPFLGSIKLMLLSKEQCMPFDKNRNGMNLGEGAGIMILESKHFAAKRNCKKLGSVLGYGNYGDGYHEMLPEPSGKGLRKSLKCALERARITPDDICFVNPHATGSIPNDAVEAHVINSMLKDVLVTSTKCRTGHAMGAAGAIEACLSLICLNNSKLPSAGNFRTIDASINVIPVLAAVEMEGKNAAVSTCLGFGGCNSALVIGGQKYE